MSSAKHDVFCLVLEHILSDRCTDLPVEKYREFAREAMTAANAIWDEVKQHNEASGEGIAAQADKLLDKMRS